MALPANSARLVISLGVALATLLATPLFAHAQVTGPCYLTGYESHKTLITDQLDSPGTSGPGVTDLSTRPTWTVQPDTSVAVKGETAVAPKYLRVDMAFFGVGVPFFDAQGSRRTASYSWAMNDLAPFTRVFGFTGTTDACAGRLDVVVNESPLLTVAGGAGALLGAIGSIGLIRMAFRRRKTRFVTSTGRLRYGLRRRIGAVLLGAFFGLLFGVGEGLYLQEAGTISPTDRRALVIPAVALLLGLLAGILGGRRFRRKKVSPEVAEMPELVLSGH